MSKIKLWFLRGVVAAGMLGAFYAAILLMLTFLLWDADAIWLDWVQALARGNALLITGVLIWSRAGGKNGG